MGYAQIAGLPAVYGLYGSVFPIILFSLFSTSPQFIFGVDAAPAALIGGALLSFEIEAQSAEALAVVPVLTFYVGAWLLLFFILGAGKLVNFISKPVMGGFISGVCCTVIMMQVPKLFGGTAGTGELFELLEHIIQQLPVFNPPSFLLGVATLAIVLTSKKICPKFPMAVVMIVFGALFAYFAPVERMGIACLSSVEPGLPHFAFPDFFSIPFTDAIGASLSVAVVIMAQTLLAENNFALKRGYKLNDNQEILAFSLGNFASAFTGCCPVNGSVPRTAMNDQYEGKTQLTGMIAGVTMMLVLLFCTGFIGYLPVPVLTAVVMTALIGALELKLAAKLKTSSKGEFYIFMGAFFAVLVLGTINGVLVGIILSFTAVILRASNPPRCFLGVIPGHEDFHDLSQFNHIYPVKGVILYRFTSDLFFANVGIFQADIENSIMQDTRAVIVDAAGIGSIDSTAAERLMLLYESLGKRGIAFYLTGHVAELNDQMRTLGIGGLIQKGAVRRTMETALADIGMEKPYPIDGAHPAYDSVARKRAENTLHEFMWAYGSGCEAEMERQINQQIEELQKTGDIETLIHGSWNQLGAMDEDEWLEHLEAHLAEISRISGKDEYQIALEFERRRVLLGEKIAREHPNLAKRFMERRELLDAH
ncbi:MAG: SulP family inorganic anion transporter, partial [Muribaculaceae bacterium]|nr:SulP family inorganic anion transporter [Muribaculaceae bacterium]